MRILIMANFLAGSSGNFINSLLALADFCKSKGDGVCFLFPLRDDGTEPNWMAYIRDAGYTVYTYNNEQNNSKEFLADLIKAEKIDLIHSHFSCMHNLLLWDEDIRRSVKILLHDHMDYIAGQPEKPQKQKQKKLAKRYRMYGIGVISVMKKKNRGYLTVPKHKYIPNGLTLKRNVSRSLTREEYREKLGLSENDRLCLFLGWDIYRKGVDTAIKAIRKCRESNDNIYLGIVGFGPRPSEQKVEIIEKYLGFSPFCEGVRFLDTEEDMFALHRAADVYISASRTEAFSYGLLEAISQNVPIAVSNIPGTRWAAKYTKCRVFDTESPDDCARAVSELLPLRWKESNRDKFMKKYNIDDWCKRVYKMYKRMVSSGVGR